MTNNADNFVTYENGKIDITNLVGKFGEVGVVNDGCETIFTKMKKVNLAVHEGNQTKILKVPASGYESEFVNPAKKAIEVGTVFLNDTCEYLKDLPFGARAKYLIAPWSTATICNRGLCGRSEDIVDIRRIHKKDGFSYEDYSIPGLKIFDYFEDGNNNGRSYLEEWASVQKAAWEYAKSSGENVMTGFALSTPELVQGCKADYESKKKEGKIIVDNLRDRAPDLNDIIAGQNRANGYDEDKGRIIIVSRGNAADTQSTSQRLDKDWAGDPVWYGIPLSGIFDSSISNDCPQSSRPAAMLVLAPNNR